MLGAERGRQHGVLAVGPLLPLLGGQTLREAEHEDGRAEEQRAAQQEAGPPGADPARVLGRDAQLAWRRREEEEERGGRGGEEGSR